MQDKLTQVHERVHPEVATDANGTAKKSSKAGWIWLVVLAIAGTGGYYYWRSTQTQAAAGATAGAAGGKGRRAGNQGPAVPVVVATVKRQSLPIYLDGLGSVSAYYTVTLKSRVDGQIMEVDFKEGQEVKKGDLLAVIDPRPYEVALAQAQANLVKDQAQLADAKLDANRYDQLVKQGVIAQQQFDTQHALAGQLEGAVESDQAAIESAKLNVVYSKITSPIDGRVGLRLVDPGNIVHAADANGFLVITQMEPISVIFTIPEDSLPTVISHMRQGELTVKAMTRDLSSELATGVLQTINNQIDQTTGTVQLKAVFDNKDRALWPNQFVNARLLLDTQRDALVIPSAAIQTGSQGTFVYVVKQDRTVEVRPVTVAVTEGNISSISSGLTGGETVVTDGQDRLQEGVVVDARAGGDAQAQAAVPKASNTGKPPTGPPPGGAPGAPGERGPYGGGQNGGQRNPKQYRPDQGGQQQGVPKT